MRLEAPLSEKRAALLFDWEGKNKVNYPILELAENASSRMGHPR